MVPVVALRFQGVVRLSFKITFVNAPNIQYDQNYGVTLTPVWAYTLAAHLPEGWDPLVFDVEIEGKPSQLEAADVFAFSGMNKDLGTVRQAWEQVHAKFPDATFVIGGPATWSLEQEDKLDLLDYFDYIFILDGEQTLPAFLSKFAAGSLADQPKVIQSNRFPVKEAKPVRFDLFRPNAEKYYGALIEVSRGCPFLCEFCDIRVLPGNNRANVKPVEVVIHELDEYYKMGIRQFIFVCDNFIGDIQWARQCAEAMIEWQENLHEPISVFTWLTINLYKIPDLMKKMRLAGFSMCNIGIESVNYNSLLETAKVQNEKVDLENAVRTIQSYGFVVVPGWIFGFDSDSENLFQDTLAFNVDAGLIGGEPAFLQALPGTPLYKRLEKSNRLVQQASRDVVVRKGNVGLERRIETNVRYLLDGNFLAEGYIEFMRVYNSASWQFARFEGHMKIIAESSNYIGQSGAGYASPIEYLKFQLKKPENLKMLLRRILWLTLRPRATIAVIRAWLLTRKMSRKFEGIGVHFNYWVYVWTNMAMKNAGLREEHVKLHSVGPDFDYSKLAPLAAKNFTNDATDRGDEKRAQQARFTNQALERLVQKEHIRFQGSKIEDQDAAV